MSLEKDYSSSFAYGAGVPNTAQAKVALSRLWALGQGIFNKLPTGVPFVPYGGPLYQSTQSTQEQLPVKPLKNNQL